MIERRPFEVEQPNPHGIFFTPRSSQGLERGMWELYKKREASPTRAGGGEETTQNRESWRLVVTPLISRIQWTPMRFMLLMRSISVIFILFHIWHCYVGFVTFWQMRTLERLIINIMHLISVHSWTYLKIVDMPKGRESWGQQRSPNEFFQNERPTLVYG